MSRRGAGHGKAQGNSRCRSVPHVHSCSACRVNLSDLPALPVVLGTLTEASRSHSCMVTLVCTLTAPCRRTIMDDPFIRNYVEDLLKKIRTQVGPWEWFCQGGASHKDTQMRGAPLRVYIRLA